MELPAREIDGLIFDCDGTLVDTMPAYWWSWRRTCQQYGLDFNERRFYSLAGVPVRDMLQMLIDEAFPRGAALEDRPDIEEVLVTKKAFADRAIEQIGTPAIECVVSIAKQYHGKMPLAVASSGSRDHVMQSLQMTGIVHLFDVIVTSEDVTRHKPAPDIFLEAAKRMKCDPKKCIAFEDADNGIKAIKAAGMEAMDVRTFPGYPKVVPSSVSVLQEKVPEEDELPSNLVLDKLRFVIPIVVVVAIALNFFMQLLKEAIIDAALED